MSGERRTGQGRRGGGFERAEPHSHSLAPEDVIRFKVKAELRKRMRAIRKTAPLEACAERSARIAATLEATDLLKHATGVALFWPMLERHEVDLRPLDASLRRRGVRVAYPSIDPETGEMTFRFVEDPTQLVDAGYGFAEPPASAQRAQSGEIDVVVVPAIAADLTGHRIGYGAGYYDRTLPAFAPPAVAVAVVYDYQLVAEVPATAGDVRVAWVVTDQRLIDARSAP